MLDLKFVRAQPEAVKAALTARGDTKSLEGFAETDGEARALLAEIEALRHQRKTSSEQIAGLMKAKQDASALQASVRDMGARIKDLEAAYAQKSEDVVKNLLDIPNIPHASVPAGASEADNLEVRRFSAPRAFDFEPLAHWDIGENLKILDFSRAARITGSRFPLYFGKGALLERALINFMLDVHTREHGYKEVLPPFIVNRQSMTGTGQLPKFAQDLFKLESWDYFLVPTAEVPVTNIHAQEILSEEDLPVLYTAYTPCFRAEAGAHGRDTRGLIRQHQFNKVEMVRFTTPETSYDQLEDLTRNAEDILQRLGLPYRVVTLCAADLGFSSAKTYDIEVWMPAQNTFREISSCSNFEAFQARRADIRFKRAGKKGTEFVHTLNGSGLAVGRTVAAILENFQQKDGTVVVPEALRPYMNGLEAIGP